MLDSDGLWEPTKLATQMAWLAAHPTHRIAQTGQRWLDRGRHRNPRAWHRKEERLFPRCLERCLVSPSAVVVRRDLYEGLGGFDRSFPVCEDYELWLRVALCPANAERRAEPPGLSGGGARRNHVPMDGETVEGGCFCGAVRYVARRPPAASTVCHCRSCRRTAGAPVVAWVTFAAADVSFVRGTPARFRSSAPVTRTFCTTCGTPLTYTHADRPSEIDVTTASLDAPEQFAPVAHLWCSEGIPWAAPTDGRPALPRGAGGG